MPSLKEIDTMNTAAAAAAVAESSSGGGGLNSNNKNDDSTKNGAPSIAIAKKTTTNDTLTQQQPSSTKQQIIQYEDSTKVPPDETSFTTRPHFSSNNKFHVNLQNFDLSFRCPICCEIYTNPVVLVSCMHNFCSLCIRNHLRTTYTGMKRKADCPICNVEVKLPGSNNSGYEKAIIPNKHLSQQVNLYKSCGIRDEIRSSLVRLDILEQEKLLGITKFDGGGGIGGGMEEDKLGNGNKKKKRDGNEDKSLRCSKRSRRQTTSTAAASAIKKANDSSNDDDDNEDEDYNDDVVDGDDEDYNDINNSKMPASSSSSTNQTTTNTKLKRKPPVSYHNLNKKKLIELCSKEGLDVTGNEIQLKQRHSDFIILYNSECDSDHPRSVKELVKELRKREKHIKIEANKTIPKKQSKFMKNLSNTLGAFNDGSIDRPTSGDASFDTKLDSGFAALIANARKRKMEASFLSSAAAAAAKSEHCDLSIVNGSRSPHELTNGGGDKEVAAATLLMNHKAEEMSNDKDDTVTSPGASIDSDKTVETPNKLSQMKSTKQPPKRQSSSTKTKSAAKKKRAPPKSTSASRIISYGPWTCNVCTFENLRNTSKVGPCEMCNNPRPKDTLPSITQPKDDVEVVNIDC